MVSVDVATSLQGVDAVVVVSCRVKIKGKLFFGEVYGEKGSRQEEDRRETEILREKLEIMQGKGRRRQ